MKPMKTILLTAVALCATIELAGAESRARQTQAQITTLEQRAQQLSEAARSTKGGPQQELILRRARLRSMIERLQNGEHVDPQEIDSLLAR